MARDAGYRDYDSSGQDAYELSVEEVTSDDEGSRGIQGATVATRLEDHRTDDVYVGDLMRRKGRGGP